VYGQHNFEPKITEIDTSTAANASAIETGSNWNYNEIEPVTSAPFLSRPSTGQYEGKPQNLNTNNNTKLRKCRSTEAALDTLTYRT